MGVGTSEPGQVVRVSPKAQDGWLNALVPSQPRTCCTDRVAVCLLVAPCDTDGDSSLVSASLVSAPPRSGRQGLSIQGLPEQAPTVVPRGDKRAEQSSCTLGTYIRRPFLLQKQQ